MPYHLLSSFCTSNMFPHSYLSIGAAGGSRIITATAQSVWHILSHNMTVPEALAQARLHDQLLPARTTFEDSLNGKIVGFDARIVEDMKRRGHNVTWLSQPEAAVQGIRRLWDGTFEAGSEPRQQNSGGLAV
jgi:gamma-glutamyltranspeptidase/glutathione hydrolase